MKIFGFVSASVMVISLVYAPVAFADAAAGKELFNSKTKKCKICHKFNGDPTKFKPVGPGLKNEFKRIGSHVGDAKKWLKKWLSPNNVELWGNALGDKSEIIGVPEDKHLKDIMSRYKAAKRGKDMKKSQMVRNFQPGKDGKLPKIQLTDQERNDIIAYLMTL